MLMSVAWAPPASAMRAASPSSAARTRQAERRVPAVPPSARSCYPFPSRSASLAVISETTSPARMCCDAAERRVKCPTWEQGPGVRQYHVANGDRPNWIKGRKWQQFKLHAYELGALPTCIEFSHLGQ
jgi:hypothetical protein